MIQKLLKRARKIVIKIGSNTLAKEDGTINYAFICDFAAQCAFLIESGKQIVLVSSGAQVAGLSTIDCWTRKTDIHYRQALCAVGQVELMDNWRTAFANFGLHIGQLLLTKDDFSDEHRTLNMRNTLFTLVDEGVVPIINENDSVSFEEIKIGDNDNLSALTAVLWNADLLILFSDIDGVYDKNPKRFPDAQRIPVVENPAELRRNISVEGTSDFGTGGIATKIDAAEKAGAYGIDMILADGSAPRALASLADGSGQGTVFIGEETWRRTHSGR